MQRRDALKAVGATLLAPAGSPLLRGDPPKPAGWRTAFGLNGFASSSRKYNKTYPIWEVLDFASQMGLHGIELHATWPMGGYPKPNETKRIDALKRLYDVYGLQIFSIQTGAGGAFAPDASERERWPTSAGLRAAATSPQGVIVLVVCALRRHIESSGGNPDRRSSFQPEALGADQEVTRGLKHSKKRLLWGVSRPCGPQRAVNTEQAPKTTLWKPTRHNNGGRPWLQEKRREAHPAVPPG